MTNKISNISGEVEVLIKLPDNEFGYGYTYDSETDEDVQSMMIQDRFTREQLVEQDIISTGDFKAYIGDNDSLLEAINDILDFWTLPTLSEEEEELVIPDLTTEQAISLLSFSDTEDYEYIIYRMGV